jgi:DNA-binding LytR/AlgR family response regulator
MPGKSGLEVAAEMGDAAHVVFVTAYGEYAIKAFENGAADYLFKPVENERLQPTVVRLKKHLVVSPPAPPADLTGLLESLLNTTGSVRADTGKTVSIFTRQYRVAILFGTLLLADATVAAIARTACQGETSLAKIVNHFRVASLATSLRLY